jgi:hypothetical protein
MNDGLDYVNYWLKPMPYLLSIVSILGILQVANIHKI